MRVGVLWLTTLALLTATSPAGAQQAGNSATVSPPNPASTAQPTPPTNYTLTATQKWAGGVEVECRGPREFGGTYLRRINEKLKARGEAGWELVSIANGPDLGFAKQGAVDCLVIAFKRPLTDIRQ